MDDFVVALTPMINCEDLYLFIIRYEPNEIAIATAMKGQPLEAADWRTTSMFSVFVDAEDSGVRLCLVELPLFAQKIINAIKVLIDVRMESYH